VPQGSLHYSEPVAGFAAANPDAVATASAADLLQDLLLDLLLRLPNLVLKVFDSPNKKSTLIHCGNGSEEGKLLGYIHESSAPDVKIWLRHLNVEDVWGEGEVRVREVGFK